VRCGTASGPIDASLCLGSAVLELVDCREGIFGSQLRSKVKQCIYIQKILKLR